MFRSFRYITLFLIAMSVLYWGNTLAQVETPDGEEIATSVANPTAEPEPTAPPDDSIVLEPDGTITIPVDPRDNSENVAIVISLLVALFTVISNSGTLWLVFRRFMPFMPVLISAAELLTRITPGTGDDAEVKKWRDWYNATNPEGVAAKMAASKVAQAAASSPTYKTFSAPANPSSGQVPDDPGFG